MKDKGSSILATEKGAKNPSSDYNEEKPIPKPKRKKWSLRKKILVSLSSIAFIYFLSVFYSFINERSHLIIPKNGIYTVYNVENKGWFRDKKKGKKFEQTYLDGKKEGLYQEWSIDGVKTVEAQFKNNEVNGSFQVWGSKGAKKFYRSDIHIYFSNDMIIIDNWYNHFRYIFASDYLGSGLMDYETAMASADDCEFYGYTDWRLPTKNELEYFMILNTEYMSRILKKKFGNIQFNKNFWSNYLYKHESYYRRGEIDVAYFYGRWNEIRETTKRYDDNYAIPVRVLKISEEDLVAKRGFNQ